MTSFGKYKNETVAILKRGKLGVLMDSYNQAAEKIENSGFDFVSAWEDNYAAIQIDNQVVLVPETEIS